MKKIKCKCGCCHVPDNGACPKSTYEKGMNGRCVYCDHGEECHEEESLIDKIFKARVHNVPL